MKNILILAIAFITVSLSAQIVSYPSHKALPDSVLHTLDYRLQKNSNFNTIDDGVTTTISGLNSTSLSFNDLAAIINNSGTIEDYVLILKVPEGFENETVNINLPDRLNAFGDAMPYAYYWRNGNVSVREGIIYIQLVNYKNEILNGAEVVDVAIQARAWNANIGVLEDYILLVNDAELNGLF